jgi:hypothetical protein
VLGVEHHHAELLDLRGAVLRQEIPGQLPRRLVAGTFEGASDERPPPQLDRRGHLRRTRRSDAWDVKLIGGGAHQPMQATRTFEQSIGQLQCTAVA